MLTRIPLLNKWLGNEAPAEALPPLTPKERARLQHRRRKLQRELKRLEKRGAGRGCGPCLQEAPSRGSVQASKLVDAMRAELAAIENRLAE